MVRTGQAEVLGRERLGHVTEQRVCLVAENFFEIHGSEPNGRRETVSASGRARVGRPERLEPGGHVVGVRVGRGDAEEELAGLGQLAGPLHEVAEHVPLAEVSFGRVADQAAAPGLDQQGHRPGQVAVVGPGPGQHQATLGQDLGVGRTLAELGEKRLHPLRAARGPGGSPSAPDAGRPSR